MTKEGITFYTVPKGYGKTYEALLNREKYLSKELEKFVKLYEKTKQENQQLKEENIKLKMKITRLESYPSYPSLVMKYKSVLDEIREYINNTFTISSVKDMYKIMDGIEEILDKVKE